MRFKESLAESGSSGLYVKLADKESIAGVFRGDPYEFKKAFKAGEIEKFRFKVNFVTQDEKGKYSAKIWEGSIIAYKDLIKLNRAYEKYGGVERVKVSITRSGVGLKTEWIVMPLPGPEQPDKAEWAEIESVKLLDLAGSSGLKVPEAPSFDDSWPTEEDAPRDDSDLPF